MSARPCWPVSRRTGVRAGWACACAAVAILAIAPARSEDLRDALIAAYQSNPGLDAERARLRATDEDVPRAQSGYRPTITGEASIASQDLKSRPQTLNDGGTRPTNWEINVRQPVFDGFRTTNAVSAAEAMVRAGRAQLGDRESATLFDAVTAFMDVVRDQAIAGLREVNVGVLSRELQAAEARRAVKEVTLTDVAQARARRARAVSAADLAKANLKISRASFLRVVGHSPEGLSEPPLAVRGLPSSIEEAHRIAEQESPRLIAAIYQEQAAKYSVDQVWGELLPRVDVEASYSQGTNASPSIEERNSASISGRLRIPFYQGGEVHARVRKAKHNHVSRIQEIEQSRADVEANVTSAWSRLMAARAQLDSDQIQVSAARTALTGVREEEKVGQRTLLDVLNAEQELLDARVSLVGTRRDMVVASYAVLASIGRLSAEGIELATDVYVPEAHYDEVRRQWAGVTITRAESHEFPSVMAVTGEDLPAVRRPKVSRRSVRLRRIEAPEEPPLLERLFKQSFGAESVLQPGDGTREARDLSGPAGAMALRGPVAAGTVQGAVGATGSLPGFKSSLD
ncbi:MAG: TolC family outer membrane protein [Alphaproteobacteria bacterium]|nr:TolC family outer membrane protein [Alphaproteobacteria bacterium]